MRSVIPVVCHAYDKGIVPCRSGFEPVDKFAETVVGIGKRVSYFIVRQTVVRDGERFMGA